jgi:hypothetical protein
MLIPFNIGARAGGIASAFYGGNTGGGGATVTIDFPAGTAEGDIAIIVGSGNVFATFGNVSGWEVTALGLVASSNPGAAACKVLTAGNLSSRPTISASSATSYSVVIYRGGTAVSYKNVVANDAGTSISIPGFVKDGACAKVISMFVDRDPDSTGATISGTWTKQYSGAATFHSFAWADKDPNQYTDNSTAEWSGLTATNNQLGAMFEITA